MPPTFRALHLFLFPSFVYLDPGAPGDPIHRWLHRAAPPRRRTARKGGCPVVAAHQETEKAAAGAPLILWPPCPTTCSSTQSSLVFSDAGDVARCAAVCRRWGRIVAAREAAILRALPPPDRFLPHLALGFFHGGQHDLSSTRRRQLAAQAQTDPCFVPTPSASVLLGSPFPGLPEGGDGGGLFHYARPVASRGGRVVFELRRKTRADGVALSVCNPMTGDVALVPPLAGDDFPGHDYMCAVLTADDLDNDAQQGSSFFSLVLVYNRRSFTALRCYTSDDAGGGGGWGPEFRKPGTQISGHVLQRLGPAVVLRGVVYWPIMVAAALAVRLDGGAAAAVMDVHVVPYTIRDTLPDWRLLGTTPDGRLSYVSAGLMGGELLSFGVETLDVSAAAGAEWERGETSVLTQLTVPMLSKFELKMRWLGEKSGTLFFTIGEGCSTSGAFAVNLATGSVDKLADGVECNSWRSLYGYEMDPTALLASIAARFN
uniref:F-box domain-containing protein n=1 Tax=Setaria viridis TaxID=4556 RepID=A0A4U6W7G8_SETVI|nr:hypothetical protein SEVIR_1G111550v2 [Setaria viridis]